MFASRKRDPPAARPTVLLDTNALFLPVRVGFPLESEVDRLVPGTRMAVAASTVRELDRLIGRRTAGAIAARALADRFRRAETALEGDEAIVELAVRRAWLVVTADRELQRRLAERGIAVLVPRDRHRLELRPGRSARDQAPRARRAARGNG